MPPLMPKMIADTVYLISSAKKTPIRFLITADVVLA